MTDLDIDTLRTLARVAGLDLAEDELERLLPLVRFARRAAAELDELGLDESEPAVHFRML
jgi:hypothetical protein